MCWVQRWTTLAWTFVRSLGWVESSNKDFFASFWFLGYTFLHVISVFFFFVFPHHCHCHVNALISYNFQFSTKRTFQSIFNSQIQKLGLQVVIENIAWTLYYIPTSVDHHLSLFLSHSFSLLLVLTIADQNIEIPRANLMCGRVENNTCIINPPHCLTQKCQKLNQFSNSWSLAS
jgi:hypothetical protein